MGMTGQTCNGSVTTAFPPTGLAGGMCVAFNFTIGDSVSVGSLRLNFTVTTTTASSTTSPQACYWSNLPLKLPANYYECFSCGPFSTDILQNGYSFSGSLQSYDNDAYSVSVYTSSDLSKCRVSSSSCQFNNQAYSGNLPQSFYFQNSSVCNSNDRAEMLLFTVTCNNALENCQIQLNSLTILP